jgi:hypothetical protein
VSQKYIELIEVAVVVASSTAWSTRPPIQLLLTDAERAELLARLAIRNAPADEKLRIRIVLACAQGESGTAIARRLGGLNRSSQHLQSWRCYGKTCRVDAEVRDGLNNSL